jgi:osmotically-inducible protein OsmY
MDTSLQGANLTTDEQAASVGTYSEEEQEAEHHVHLPNPSLWPFILSTATMCTVAGFLALPDIPWLSIVSAPFVLIGILGWALEDPMAAPSHDETTYAGPSPTLKAEEVLSRAKEVVERMVTVGSTAWSAHPVRVEVEGEDENGIVLALYGKVELEAQKRGVEAALWQLPNVADVKNYMVAEDTILTIAEARLENLRAKGKLDGATNLSILVENYILSLYGDVPNKEMKYTLEREMAGIPGVRVIINHIGLNKEIPGNLGRTRNI